MGTPKDDNPVLFSYYLVALIDILGQKEALHAIKELPKAEGEKKEFVAAIRKSFGVVEGTRKSFNQFFTGFYADDERANILPPELKESYQKLIGSQLKSQSFSDTLIFFSSLADDPQYLRIYAMYAAIVSSGSIMLGSLAVGHPIRGAIEVDIGAEMYEGEIYGPCLNKAHYLESTAAQYPRIIVGDNAIGYLLSKKDQTGKGQVVTYQGKTAQSCLDMLARDSDGYFIVDYLGRNFVHRVGLTAVHSGMLEKAFSYVETQARKYMEERNTKLALRYNLLRQYFITGIEELKATH